MKIHQKHIFLRTNTKMESYQQPVDEKTLDYMYAGYLTNLKMEVMNSEDFKMIKIVKHWLDLFNNAHFSEKMARNCLVCLLSQQLRISGTILEPFSNPQNMNLDLNTLLNRLGLTSGEPSLISPLVSPMFNAAVSPLQEFHTDHNQTNPAEPEFHLSMDRSLSIQSASSQSYMLSEKLEDIHKIISELKASKRFLKAEVVKLKNQNILLVEKLRQQDEKLKKNQTFLVHGAIENFMSTLSTLSLENFQNADLKLFEKLFQSDSKTVREYDEIFEKHLKQIFIENIKLKANTDHCCCVNFNTSTGLSSISDLSRQIVNSSKFYSKSLHNRRRFRDIILEKYRQQKRKFQFQNRVIRFKFISLITRIFMRNKEKNYEEFQTLITQLDTKYMSILNSCSIHLSDSI